MCGVDEVRVLTVYLQDVENHLPNQHGQGENLAEDRMAAQLFGGCDVEGDTDGQEQTPPLDIPIEREDE